MYTLTCKICSYDFEAVTTIAKYCSAKCRQRKYRNTRKGKQAYTQYNRSHYNRPKIQITCKVCNKSYLTAKQNQAVCNKPKCKSKAKYMASKEFRNKNPQQIRANGIVNKRIQRGISLHKQPCQICNNHNAEAHHNDYSKPLDITWLCKQHHHELHKDKRLTATKMIENETRHMEAMNNKAKDMMDISLHNTLHIAMNNVPGVQLRV